jgi:hypothetical protein
LRLRVVVDGLLTVRYLTASPSKDTAGGTAGFILASLPDETITYATSRRTMTALIDAERDFLDLLLTIPERLDRKRAASSNSGLARTQ